MIRALFLWREAGQVGDAIHGEGDRRGLRKQRQVVEKRWLRRLLDGGRGFGLLEAHPVDQAVLQLARGLAEMGAGDVGICLV